MSEGGSTGPPLQWFNFQFSSFNQLRNNTKRSSSAGSAEMGGQGFKVGGEGCSGRAHVLM